MHREKRSTSNKKQKGQLSVFLGVVMMIMMTMLAFVVNVGLFVKAKINLQNAVDAAAFSGAAVQARQLSNIGYLNWEMRNVYKEWMFKYYVLGQLGLTNTYYSSITGGTNVNKSYVTTDPMNFRQVPFWDPTNAGYNANEFDKFNIPSICIHFAGNHNICDIKGVPGVPRFQSVGLLGLDQTTQVFIDAISRAKALDCSERSGLNFLTAMLWAYNVGSVDSNSGTPGSLGNQAGFIPEIAYTRPGAWISSMELALRIRNLEAIVNTAPQSQPVCRNGTGCIPYGNLESTEYPENERVVKAFLSAYRNLGTESEDEAGFGSTLRTSFKLEELEPTQANVSEISNFLIPTGHPATVKRYVDLIPMTINYSTFFTTFVSDRGSDIPGVDSDARCAGTKTALPVPGYILGFYKNPNVLTYYAVKGSAKYVGLFYPFQDQMGIELKAYAAAKPFGGRVGPMLFQADGNSLTSRAGIPKSRAYVSGVLPNGNAYVPGYPIPTSSSFWINLPSEVVGGTPTGGNIKFGIPNMIYEYLAGNMGNHSSGTDQINIITEAGSDMEAYNNTGAMRYGLYDKDQFIALASNLDGYSAGNHLVTHAEVGAALDRLKKPTLYEAANYLIPTEFDPADNLDSPSPIILTQDEPSIRLLFAPLYGPHTLYQSINDVKNAIQEQIDVNAPSIDAFMTALNEVATTIRQMSSGGGASSVNYNDAANSIHTGSNVTDPDCVFSPAGSSGVQLSSLAGRLNKFLRGVAADEAPCGFKPLPLAIQEGWDAKASSDQSFGTYYRMVITPPSDPLDPTNPNSEISNIFRMSAYVPGVRKGATDTGELPFSAGGGGSAATIAKRNFYSTKFIAIGKLLDSSSTFSPYIGNNFITLGEFGTGLRDDQTGNPPTFENYLRSSDIVPDFGDPKH